MSRNYEMVLMLDPEATDAVRDGVAGDVRAKIEGAGTLERADDWGLRKLAYEIRQRTEADYRYFRFQGTNELLDQLDHSLKITDGALRFRIFRVDPETPTDPPPLTERPAAVGSERRGRDDRPRRDE